jgi:hypothetical protein
VTGCCVHCKETAGSIKCGEFLDKADELIAFQEGLLSKELRSYLVCRDRPKKIKHGHLLSDER